MLKVSKMKDEYLKKISGKIIIEIEKGKK